MAAIGFIGLGIMGRPMCENLLKAGHRLKVYNRTSRPIEHLLELGAVLGNSPKDVASNSEVIITMLPDGPEVAGALAIDFTQAGYGISLQADTLPNAAPGSGSTITASHMDPQQFLLNIFPKNLAQAVEQNQVMQLTVFSLLFGIFLAMLPNDKRAPAQ